MEAGGLYTGIVATALLKGAIEAPVLRFARAGLPETAKAGRDGSPLIELAHAL
jgi:hypothetical protein